MRKLFRILLSIPKTCYVNFLLFPISIAIRFPLLVSWDVKFSCKRGQLVIPTTIRTAMIRIGISNGSFNLSDGRRTIFEVQGNGRCSFEGSAKISKGSAIIVAEKAELIVGDNFFCNANFLCSVAKRIKFGKDFLAGWDCTVIDGDGHSIVDCRRNIKSAPKDIVIGNHVWISARSCLLKGTMLPDDTIVSFGAIASGVYEENNCVIGNGKAGVLKENIMWC